MTKQKMEKPATSGGFLSLLGLLLSLLGLLVVLVLGAVAALATKGELFMLLNSQFYLGWLVYALVLSLIYSKFIAGGENYVSALVVAVLGYVLIWLSYYVTLLLLVIQEYPGTSIFEVMKEMSFFSFIESYLKNGWTIGSLELRGWTGLLFDLIGPVLISFFIWGNISSQKGAKLKKQQSQAVEEDFLARNQGADIANPFIRARMWTEQGLRTKQGMPPVPTPPVYAAAGPEGGAKEGISFAPPVAGVQEKSAAFSSQPGGSASTPTPFPEPKETSMGSSPQGPDTPQGTEAQAAPIPLEIPVAPPTLSSPEAAEEPLAAEAPRYFIPPSGTEPSNNVAPKWGSPVSTVGNPTTPPPADAAFMHPLEPAEASFTASGLTDAPEPILPQADTISGGGVQEEPAPASPAPVEAHPEISSGEQPSSHSAVSSPQQTSSAASSPVQPFSTRRFYFGQSTEEPINTNQEGEQKSYDH